MRRLFSGFLLLALFATLTFVACGGGSTSTSTSNSPSLPNTSSTVYVTGADAPLPAVVGFQIQIDALTLSDGTHTQQVLAEPMTVDFSRLLGLRTLLGLNQILPGTYNSASLQVSKAVISYLDLSGATPKINTINATLTNSIITLPLNPALTIADKGLGGLHMHFNLRDSIFTDPATGQITGQVNPQIQLRVLNQGDEDTHVDELLGGVVSVDVPNNQFVMQRWHGRNITVKVNNQTQWTGQNSNTWTLASLQPNYTVEISGVIQADGSILADSVEVESIDKFLLGGLLLQVVPPTGAADTFSMFVRTSMPDVAGVGVPGTATLNVTGNTNFDIRMFNLPIESFLFNRSMMVMGQRVGVAGTINPDNSLNVRRVVLRRQGLEGVRVPGSVVLSGSGDKDGYFMLQNNALFGLILGQNGNTPAPIKVKTSSMTVFKNLPNHLNDVATTDSHLVMWGLILKDATTGNPVFVAGYVAKVTN
jgi:hypothetical protein